MAGHDQEWAIPNRSGRCVLGMNLCSYGKAGRRAPLSGNTVVWQVQSCKKPHRRHALALVKTKNQMERDLSRIDAAQKNVNQIRVPFPCFADRIMLKSISKDQQANNLSLSYERYSSTSKFRNRTSAFDCYVFNCTLSLFLSWRDAFRSWN